MNEFNIEALHVQDRSEGRSCRGWNGNKERDGATGRFISVGKPFDRKAHGAKYYLDHKEAYRKYGAKRYAENPEKAKLRSREYVQTHKEEVAAYRKQFREKNRERLKAKDREYYAANRERFKVRAKIYGKLYRSSESRKAAQYRYNNSEKGKGAVRLWNKTKGQLPKHWAVRVAANARRRALETGVALPCASVAIKKIRASRNPKCFYCGKRIPRSRLHVDHVNPVALGGVHAAYNLVGACQSCNLHKSKKHPNQFITGQQILVF